MVEQKRIERQIRQDINYQKNIQFERSKYGLIYDHFSKWQFRYLLPPKYTVKWCLFMETFKLKTFLLSIMFDITPLTKLILENNIDNILVEICKYLDDWTNGKVQYKIQSQTCFRIVLKENTYIANIFRNHLNVSGSVYIAIYADKCVIGTIDSMAYLNGRSITTVRSLYMLFNIVKSISHSANLYKLTKELTKKQKQY